MKLIQHLTILLLTKRCVSIPLQLQHCQFESRLLLELSNTTHIHFPPILYINTKLLKSNNACRWAVVVALRRAHDCGAKLVRSWVPVPNGGATLQTHDQQVVGLNPASSKALSYFHSFSKCGLT